MPARTALLNEASDRSISVRLPARYWDVINLMAHRTKKNRAEYLRNLIIQHATGTGHVK